MRRETIGPQFGGRAPEGCGGARPAAGVQRRQSPCGEEGEGLAQGAGQGEEEGEQMAKRLFEVGFTDLSNCGTLFLRIDDTSILSVKMDRKSKVLRKTRPHCRAGLGRAEGAAAPGPGG